MVYAFWYMLLRFPKDDASTHWTQHVKDKMVYYGLGEGRIRRVIKNGVRREEGVAPNTVAIMQRNDTQKRKEEIWVMVQESEKLKAKSEKLEAGDKKLAALEAALHRPKITIISAWRYPGVTKPGKAIPIPEDILVELGEMVE